jgi:putative ABC transport system ATP-binding protein
MKGYFVIELHNISKIFRTDTVETLAIDSINLEVSEGEFVAIMGPSGCGKSTLLSILGMLDSPTSGSYKFRGREIAGLSEHELVGVRKANIGFIFQNFNLIDELSVRENIELAVVYRSVSAAERRQRADAVMEKVGITHRANHRPGQLSGGQQQRVAVARALVGQPQLILADEPTGNLDTAHGDEVMKMLTLLHQEGATIVMVTHSPAHADYASRVVDMLDGRVLIDHHRLGENTDSSQVARV